MTHAIHHLAALALFVALEAQVHLVSANLAYTATRTPAVDRSASPTLTARYRVLACDQIAATPVRVLAALELTAKQSTTYHYVLVLPEQEEMRS